MCLTESIGPISGEWIEAMTEMCRITVPFAFVIELT